MQDVLGEVLTTMKVLSIIISVSLAVALSAGCADRGDFLYTVGENPELEKTPTTLEQTNLSGNEVDEREVDEILRLLLEKKESCAKCNLTQCNVYIKDYNEVAGQEKMKSYASELRDELKSVLEDQSRCQAAFFSVLLD